MSTLPLITLLAFDCHACPVGECPHITVPLPEHRSRANIAVANSLLQESIDSIIDTDDEEEEEEEI